MALGAIGEVDDRVRANERMREFERIKESESEERKRRGRFL